MYDDVPDEELMEEWSDEIQSFVPAFAGVNVQEIGDRSYDAHLAIDEEGRLAIRLMDANETIKFQFLVKDIFEFDTEQFHLESWELYYGLIETLRQMEEIMGDFKGRFAATEHIMSLRDDQPPVN